MPRAIGAGRVDVDERHLDTGDPAQQEGDAAADHPCFDHGDPVTDEWGGVPQRVDRGLDRASQNRPLGGTSSGTTTTAAAGTT